MSSTLQSGPIGKYERELVRYVRDELGYPYVVIDRYTRQHPKLVFNEWYAAAKAHGLDPKITVDDKGIHLEVEEVVVRKVTL